MLPKLSQITDRDILIFALIHRHGGFLWSNFLYAGTRHLGVNHTWLRHRLRQLYDAGFLDYHPILKDPRVWNDYFPYVLTDKSRDILRRLEKLDYFPAPPDGGPAHASMTNAITASIEIAARDAGVKFISQDQIIRKAPAKTQAMKNPYALPTHIKWTFNGTTSTSDADTVADRIFGLEYPAGFRFFALEADRGKETLLPSASFKNSSILRKWLSYKNIFETGVYKEQWGIPNLMVLFVTTAEERVKNILGHMPKVFERGSSYMLTTWIPGFQLFHKAPTPQPQLYAGEWKRSGKEPFFINDPANQ